MSLPNGTQPAARATSVLVARCENVHEPDGTSCTGRLSFRWGQTEAACDTCGGRCGIAVADWLAVQPDGPAAATEDELRAAIRDVLAEKLTRTARSGMAERAVDRLTNAILALPEMQRLVELTGDGDCGHHSWTGLMALLDEHWPADLFPTRADDPGRDAGARIVSLLRWVDRLQQQSAGEDAACR